MNVYIWTDSPLPYKYSYDFRNKTAAQITAAGWTIGSKNSVGYNLNSNWLWNLASWDTTAWATYPMPIDITEANKITFTLWSYGGSTAAYAGSIKVWLSAWTLIDWWTSTVNQTRIYNISGSSVDQTIQVYNRPYWNIISWTTSYWSWTGFLTCVIDFPNNTITYNKTSPVSYFITHTLTTAEKNAILAAKSYFFVSATTYNSTTTNYIQTMSIAIE